MVSQHEIRCNILTGGEEAEGGRELEGEGRDMTLGMEKGSLKVQKNPVIA